MVRENSSYYVLGFVSTNDRRDGKLRNITVRVAGYPEAQVTYRKRYAAPRVRRGTWCRRSSTPPGWRRSCWPTSIPPRCGVR